jgi:hypothetical protein
LNLISPVVKSEFQFRLLNFTQKCPNANEKILWFKQEFSAKSHQSRLSGRHGSRQGANLADENAVCDRLEIFRAARAPKYD